MMASCSGSDGEMAEEPGNGDGATDLTAITFRSSVPGLGEAHKAARTTTPLEDIATDFAVRALKTTGGETQVEMGLSSDINVPYIVRYETRGAIAGWYYDGIGTQIMRYWDNAATEYLFSAYSPVADPAVNTVTWDAEGYVSISGVEGNTTGGTDWMVARLKRDAAAVPITDTDLLAGSTLKTPGVLSETVDMLFHRLLARVEFRIYSGSGDAFTVTDFRVDGADGGEFATVANYAGTADWDSPARWTPTTTATNLMDFTGLSINVTGTDREHASAISYAMEIPQAMATGQKMVLTLIIDGATVNLDIPADYVDWHSNTFHLYILQYTPGEESLILASLLTTPWEYGGELDDTQTNW